MFWPAGGLVGVVALGLAAGVAGALVGVAGALGGVTAGVFGAGAGTGLAAKNLDAVLATTLLSPEYMATIPATAMTAATDKIRLLESFIVSIDYIS